MTINPDIPYQAEVVFGPDNSKLSGEVIQLNGDEFAAKIPASQVVTRQELQDVLSDGEQPVTVWLKLTDKVPGRLLEEGELLWAWMRVKRLDGRFVTKSVLFSLGAVVAVTVTGRAIRHYKPR